MSVRVAKQPNVDSFKFYVKYRNDCDESVSNEIITQISKKPD